MKRSLHNVLLTILLALCCFGPTRHLGAGETPDNLELIKKLHALIVKTDQAAKASPMADYSSKVPKTGAAYRMVAIEGGKFLMGSPLKEAHRQDNEGPQVIVQVEPFWIGKHEVTWDEYEPFMITQVDREKNGARQDFNPQVHSLVDAVSQPTPPYCEMSFGMGQRGYPAISMTQHAANKYCQWLSAQTGHFYPPAHRSGVGICVPSRHDHGLFFRG